MSKSKHKRGKGAGQSLALINQAKLALNKGQLRQCREACKEILKQNPGEPAGYVIDGFALMQLGELNAAIGRFQSGVALAPDAVEAQLALSNALFAAKRFDEAVRHGRLAIQLDPGDDEVTENLANQCLKHQLFSEAIPILQSLRSRHPKISKYALQSASVFQALGLEAQAEEVWDDIAQNHPQLAVAWLMKGKAALARQQNRNALEFAKKAIALEPKSLEAHLLAGLASSEQGYGAEAAGYFRRVLDLEPSNPIANASLGLALQEQGQFAEAKPFLEHSLESWPTNGMAYYALVRSSKQTDDNWVKRMEASRAANPQAPLLDLSYMAYALGKSYEDLAEFENAWKNYEEANALAREFWFKGRPFHQDRHIATVDRMMRAYTSESIRRLGGAGLNDRRPVFIIGMIRSGTTLVEQIVSAHPEVAAAGELTFWHENAHRILPKGSDAPDGAAQFAVAQEYVRMLDGISDSTARITDKLPHNFELAGMIAAALPHAKFVLIKRQPLDNCLSIYTTAYQKPPGFALDKSNIVLTYREHLRITDHWRSVLPASVLYEVNYEELVANSEERTRKLIDFLGLEWSDDCLRPEDNKRSVHTPSTWQVRQPIYRTAVGRAERFKPWLGEFLDLA